MAANQHLVTWQRLLFGSAVALGVPYLALGAHGALIVAATVLFVAAAAIYYAKAILGGVVGDYLGARARRLVWPAAAVCTAAAACGACCLPATHAGGSAPARPRAAAAAQLPSPTCSPPKRRDRAGR